MQFSQPQWLSVGMFVTGIAALSLLAGPGSARGQIEERRSVREDTTEREASAQALRSEDLRAPDLGIWFRRGTADLLIIDDLSRSGPIAQFGFVEGDRIVSVNGQRVTRERHFLNVLLDEKNRAKRVPVVVIRDSRGQLIYVRPDLLVGQAEAIAVDPLDRLGVVLDDRYVDRIVVWRVLPRSPAYYAGLRPGDVILDFDGVRIEDAGDFARLIDQADAADIAIGIRRNQEDAELFADLRVPVVVEAAALPVVPRNEALDDLRPDPYFDRRLTPRPDVPPGMRIPGGEVGRERGPIAPATRGGGSPTTPMRPGFPR